MRYTMKVRESETVKIYKQLLKTDQEKIDLKQSHCAHVHWCTRCSRCKKILDSDKRDLKQRSKAIVNPEVSIS